MGEPSHLQPTESTLGITIDEFILVIMVIFSLFGVGITNLAPQDAFLYWISMIFAFGIAAMISGWWQVKEKGHVRGHLLKDLLFLQSLHWLGSLVTVLGIFVMLHSGRMSNETAGLVMQMILGLAAFLDGIRIGWRFSLAGAYLVVAAVIASTMKNDMPLLIILGLALVAATVYWEKYRRKQQRSSI